MKFAKQTIKNHLLMNSFGSLQLCRIEMIFTVKAAEIQS